MGAPLAVEAEIDHDAREPGAERRQRLPAGGMGPDAEHRFLGDVFGLGGVAENAAGETSHGRQVAPGKQAECLLVAAGLGLPVGPLFWIGVAVVAAVLAYEHSLVSPRDWKRLDTAFFAANGVISIAFFAFVLAEVLV